MKLGLIVFIRTGSRFRYFTLNVTPVVIFL